MAGFVAPFVFPDLVWDFQLPNVKSINVSGHKYGLVYAGETLLASCYEFGLHRYLLPTILRLLDMRRCAAQLLFACMK